MGTVLTTQYLIFTTGYGREDDLGETLCAEAIYLTRLLNQLRPKDPEIEGALALMLLTHARRRARVCGDGVALPPERQDRSQWDQSAIAEGQDLLEVAMGRGHAGPFQIKAAISDCHLSNGGPDWPQIALLYQALWRFEPTPVVALNWAVVAVELGQVAEALSKLDALSDDLETYQPYHAVRANLLSRLGRTKDAAASYDRAIEMADHEPTRRFLVLEKGKL